MGEEFMFQWAINGPEVSKMVTLPVGVTVMGRQPGVDILLEHPLVSRRHAQVVTTPTTCELTDLGSSNGTRLNGRALPANTPTYLHHNDVVEMGPFKIVVGVTAVAVEPEPEPELEPEPTAELAAGPEPEPSPEAAAATAPEAPPAAPSFVAAARRRAFWSSRPMRAALWSLLTLLVLGLALQATLSRRDWLAAHAPGLTPTLELLCQPWACQVRPYRQLEAIVIDSSAFNRSGTDSFRFSVTLRNTADLPVATPALELTLTDAADQLLLRRVIGAAELGAPPALAARGEFSASQGLSVADSASPSSIVGYRLVAFYP